MAMPVTQALDQGTQEQRDADFFVQLNPLPSLVLKPETGIKALAGMGGNSLLLMDLAKHPGAEFEAVLVKGEALPGVGPRPNIQAEQELFSGGAKEVLISAELKNIVKDLRGELHQLTGDHFRNAQAAGEAEQERLARRLDEAKSARDEAAHSAGRALSEEERRLGARQLAVMTEQLLEEIKPWAITALVLFGLFHAAQAQMRKQAAVKLVRARSSRQASHQAADPLAATVQEAAQPAPRRVRVRQRIRLGSAATAESPSKSRQRRPF
ncbi:hypothetical protein [Roseateles sp.]|uniref:hypothetical protein n=1 Tax=Roseateles sp. TaxID=1971397 RepID=UPI00286CB2F2|nr:hypothetical protein [Roseateles sp.]